jgi:hypothetical protein
VAGSDFGKTNGSFVVRIKQNVDNAIAANERTKRRDDMSQSLSGGRSGTEFVDEGFDIIVD